MTIVFGLYFVVPTLVLAHLLFGTRAGRWEVLGTAGLSLLVLGWASYALFLMAVVPVGHFTLAALNVGAAWLGHRKGWSPRRQVMLLARAGTPSPESWLVVGALALVFAGALYNFRTDGFSPSCLHAALMPAVGIPLTAAAQLGPQVPLYYWLYNMQQLGEQEGVVAALTPLTALFEAGGMRLFYAGGLALGGVYGYLAMRRVPGSTAPGRVATAVLFACLPMLLDQLWNDANTVSFLAASALLWLAMRREPGPGTLGVFMGILVATRHVAILALAGPWLLQRAARAEAEEAPASARWSWATYVTTMLLTLTPMFLRHWVAGGSPFSFESFREYGPHPHSLLGLPFQLNGMLNFPFTWPIVRTPFNPLPLFLWFPVWLVARVGVALAALTLLGAALAARPTRRLAAAALWVGPYAAMLAVNENWLQTEKMGLAAPILPLAVLAAGRGVDALARPQGRRRAALGLAALGAVVYGATWVAGRFEAPADERFYAEYPWLMRERPEYVAAERALARPALLPSPEWLRASPMLDLGDELAYDFSRPAFHQRIPSPREMLLERIIPDTYHTELRRLAMAPPLFAPAGDGETVTLRIDLSRPWLARSSFVSVAQGPAPAGDATVLRVGTSPETGSYPRFQLPWEPTYPATLTAFGRNDDVFVVLSGPSPLEHPLLPEDAPGVPAPPPPAAVVENPRPAHDAVFVVVPARSRVHFVEVLSLDPSRIYRWVLPSASAPAALEGPVHWRHD